jgi:hypothetical protein
MSILIKISQVATVAKHLLRGENERERKAAIHPLALKLH